jgi:repressor LexA
MTTKRQSDLLSFIRSFVRDRGCSPSFSEMMEALGVRSKSGVVQLLCGLEERGYIRRVKYRARAIEICDQQPTPKAIKDAYRRGFNDGVKSALKERSSAEPTA